MKLTGLCCSVLILTACATGPRVDTGPGGLPLSTWGWNVGAGDLLNPVTAPCRLGVYLDELSAQGYAKQIRIIYTYEQGPFIRDVWMPVIRAKGFRVLAILSQHSGDKDHVQMEAWIQQGLPAIRDVLDAVQLANEPDGYSGMLPAQFAEWHRAVAQQVRATLPGLPIVGPDLRGVGSWNAWVKKTGLVYGQDFDILSLHVTHQDKVATLQAFIRDVRAFTGQQTPQTWITEGDWGQTDAMSREGVMPGRTYVYVWNCNPTGNGQRCEPETRRPGGMAVPQCEQS